MTDAKKDEMAEQRAQLKAELVEEIKRGLAPKPQPSEADVARYRDEMLQMRERQASQIPPWLRAACAGGVSDADAKDLVRASHRPTGPSGMAPSGSQITGVRPGGGPARVPGGGTGWLDPIPLSPPPGIRDVDALCIADDVRQEQNFSESWGKDDIKNDARVVSSLRGAIGMRRSHE
jgi:hypothetical protein